MPESSHDDAMVADCDVTLELRRMQRQIALLQQQMWILVEACAECRHVSQAVSLSDHNILRSM